MGGKTAHFRVSYKNLKYPYISILFFVVIKSKVGLITPSGDGILPHYGEEILKFDIKSMLITSSWLDKCHICQKTRNKSPILDQSTVIQHF